MKLAGKRALITGGDYGIGEATAKLFIEEGAEVAITGSDQTTLDEAAEFLGPRTAAFRADMGDSESRKRLFIQLGERFPILDIVFANAYVSGHTTVGATSEDVFESIIRVNLVGTFFTIDSALPFLREGASVIFNGSVISALGQSGYAAYAASKAGIRALARCLAADLSPRNIRVNVISPGAIRAPIWSHYPPPTEESMRKGRSISSTIPLGRYGQAEEVAKAALFLASDDSSYVQAAELFVDGGLAGAPFGGAALQSLVP